jgi:hypothetical protein
MPAAQLAMNLRRVSMLGSHYQFARCAQVNIPVFNWKLGVECWILDIQLLFLGLEVLALFLASQQFRPFGGRFIASSLCVFWRRMRRAVP